MSDSIFKVAIVIQSFIVSGEYVLLKSENMDNKSFDIVLDEIRKVEFL